MRRIILFLLLTGCPSDLDGVESGVPDAGLLAPDASDSAGSESSRSCEVALKDPAGITRGRAGGTGGGKGPALACGDLANERIVGMAVRMSNQATLFGARSAHGIAIECARVAINTAGVAEVGTPQRIEVSGLGTYDWSPSTWTAPTMCKPGWIVSGLRVHTGADNNLFRDVSIICSQLGADGAAGATETIKIVGSLTDANAPDEVTCAPDEVLAQLGTYTGAGLDAVDLSCSRPTCR